MLDRPHNNWLDDLTGFGKVTIEPLEWLPLEYICMHLRDDDHEEVYDNLPSDNPLEFAAMVFHGVAKNGCAWVCRFNGRPASCIGVLENFYGNWQLFSFGTDDYARTAAQFKLKIPLMYQFARDRGMHRLEARSLARHAVAHKALHVIGFYPECTLVQYGRKGQDYILFAQVWPVQKKSPTFEGPATE